MIFLLFLAACATPASHIAPEGMVYIEGGLVTVGGYAVDDSHWGDRESFLKPFFIDIEPRELNFMAARECMVKKGRLPEEAELNYALKQNKIHPGSKIETTNSDVNYAGTTGGQYTVRISGLKRLQILKPTSDDTKGGFQRRCLIPIKMEFDKTLYLVLEDLHPRTGRGNLWTELPILLKKGTHINLFYKDKDWALVDLDADGPDSGGWVPMTKLKNP